ncbi:MAG: PepSY-like domain-containing protein [Phycisphaerae bacterium]|nr:PepSY-like domain-containing protein [Saprospiraceae bacterium]
MKKTMLILTAFAALAVFQWTACGKDNTVAIADLPSAIKVYVDANYPGYTLDEAEKETNCSGATVYDVEIEQGEENDLELTFDIDGNFLYSETDVASADLPTAVVNSIATNYAGFASEEPSKLTLADGSTRYEVELEKGKTDKEVLFDSEGQVICEQDEH